MSSGISDTLRQAITDSTITLSDLAELDRQQLADILNRTTFAIVRGIVDPADIREGKRRLAEQFDFRRDRPATGEHPSELMQNFQKLSIGGAEHSGVYRPRCMRTFYNPIWADDIYGLRNAFSRAARLRNLMYGFDIDYAVDSISEGFWTAARIHHYPAGGGFLVSHLDNVVPTVQQAEGIGTYFQPVILMSTCGDGADDDFSSGGGFFEYQQERFYYERECELGDIVIYSGATVHGVSDIDLHVTFDSTSIRGRMAGFMTLYRHFERKNQLEDYMPKIKAVIDAQESR